MSYCRYSDDDFQCGVYCYADVHGGYTTHVARSRPILIGPFPERVDPRVDCDAWLARHMMIMDVMENVERVPIDLPHAGEHFNDDTIEDLLVRLESLKQTGHNVPDFVIEEIRAEIAENEKAL